MELLSNVRDPNEQVAKLAVLNPSDEEHMVFVIYEVNEQEKSVRLIELDRPNDGENLLIYYEKNDVFVLNAIEVLEKVKEWK